MRKMLLYGARKGKDDEIKLFRGRRGRHLCGKRLEVFACVRMVSAEASAQEMTALHHSIKKSTKRKVVISIAIKEYSMSRDSTRQLSPSFTRGFSDALIANQRRYNLESTNNIVNSSGRRVRGFVGIEALVQPDLTPNSWRA